MDITVDEKHVQLEIAMGVTQEDIDAVIPLLSDKSLDCTSKILKKIMTLPYPDDTKAYLCFHLGKMKGEEIERCSKAHRGKAARELNGKIDDLIKEGADILADLETLKRYKSLGEDERDGQAKQAEGVE